MTKVMRKAYTEVNEILKYLPSEYVYKVPLKFRKLFNECSLPDYKVKIDLNKSVKEQNLIYETFVILTILKYNYWCESEEEKKEIMLKLKENDEKAKQKYDISMLMSKSNNSNEFKENTKEILSNNDDLLPVKIEKISWFSKIMLRIKSIFKK